MTQDRGESFRLGPIRFSERRGVDAIHRYDVHVGVTVLQQRRQLACMRRMVIDTAE